MISTGPLSPRVKAHQAARVMSASTRPRPWQRLVASCQSRRLSTSRLTADARNTADAHGAAREGEAQAARSKFPSNPTPRTLPRNVRGMPDTFGLAAVLHDFIVEQAACVARAHDHRRIATPLLEYDHVFEQTLGTDTDVVSKELYQFLDKSDHGVTLRPEGTAGAARALVTNHWYRALPQRVYYHGPMFRYENPQKGRLRQFDQFGIEAYGVADARADSQQIIMAWDFLQRLGLGNSIKLRINTIGDAESRAYYRNVLSTYLSRHTSALSPDSIDRLERGSLLRVLDSKDQRDRALIARADFPQLADYLSAASRRRFEVVRRDLEVNGVPFEVDGCLVRGLDYYRDTVFEVVYEEGSGDGGNMKTTLGTSQATVLAGGRYDGLVERVAGGRAFVKCPTTGQPSTVPCVGWAAGIQRLAMVLAQRAPTDTMRDWWQRDAHAANVAPVLIIAVPPRPSVATQNSTALLDGHDIIADYASLLANDLRRAGIVALTSDHNTSATHPLSASKQLQKLLKRTSFGSAERTTVLGDGVTCDDETVARAWFDLLRPVPRFALFVGEMEVKDSVVMVKDLESGEQKTVARERVLEVLR